MRTLAQIISWLALAGTLLPAGLFFARQMDLPQMKGWMLVAGIIWFVATPFWMGRAEAEK